MTTSSPSAYRPEYFTPIYEMAVAQFEKAAT